MTHLPGSVNRSRWTTRILLPLLGLNLAAILVGCGSKPRAPVLDNLPIYESSSEGFRFLVPAGWVQQMKAELPPGRHEKERTLVLYRSFDPSPASFEVSRRDLDPKVDMDSFLGKRKRSGAGWSQKGPPEQVSYAGRKATRYTLEAKLQDRPTTCEIVVFRPDERTYFFSGSFPSGDNIRRNQIRRILESLEWPPAQGETP